MTKLTAEELTAIDQILHSLVLGDRWTALRKLRARNAELEQQIAKQQWRDDFGDFIFERRER